MTIKRKINEKHIPIRWDGPDYAPLFSFMPKGGGTIQFVHRMTTVLDESAYKSHDAAWKSLGRLRRGRWKVANQKQTVAVASFLPGESVLEACERARTHVLLAGWGFPQ